MYSIALAAPFHPQFNAGYDNQFFRFGCDNDPQMLMLDRITFHSPFGIGPGIRFAFHVIDGSHIQNFVNFFLCDMTTIHPAAGMFCKNQLTLTVKWIFAGNKG